jgi:hypothetical protein
VKSRGLLVSEERLTEVGLEYALTIERQGVGSRDKEESADQIDLGVIGAAAADGLLQLAGYLE